MAFDDHAATVAYRTGRSHHGAPESPLTGETKMQSPPRLIGFTGLKGSGKDTAGEVFVQQGWKKISFAEPLKGMIRLLLAFRGYNDAATVERMMEGDRKEMTSSAFMGRSPRHAMQTLGTEWGRDLIHPDLWIDTFNRRAHRMLEAGDGVVVTDVRFPNEVDAIRKLGGRVFRVMRGENMDVATHDLYVAAQRHPSEALVKDLAVTGDILNNFPTARDFQVHIHDRFF